MAYRVADAVDVDRRRGRENRERYDHARHLDQLGEMAAEASATAVAVAHVASTTVGPHAARETLEPREPASRTHTNSAQPWRAWLPARRKRAREQGLR